MSRDGNNRAVPKAPGAARECHPTDWWPWSPTESEAALQGRVAQKLCRGQIVPEPCRALLSPWSIKNLTSDTETTEMNPEGGTGEEQKPLSTGHCPD